MISREKQKGSLQLCSERCYNFCPRF